MIRHRNEGLEVVSITRGHLFWHIEGRSVVVQPGSIFFNSAMGDARECDGVRDGASLTARRLSIPARAWDPPGSNPVDHPALAWAGSAGVACHTGNCSDAVCAGPTVGFGKPCATRA